MSHNRDTRSPVLTPIAAFDENQSPQRQVMSHPKLLPSGQYMTQQRNNPQPSPRIYKENQISSGFKRPLPPGDAAKLRLRVDR